MIWPREAPMSFTPFPIRAKTLVANTISLRGTPISRIACPVSTSDWPAESASAVSMKLTLAARHFSIRLAASFWPCLPITPPKKFSPEKVMVPKQISDTNRPVRPSRLYFMGRLLLSAYPPGGEHQRHADQRHHQPALDPVALVDHEVFGRPMHHTRTLQREQSAKSENHQAGQKNDRGFHFFSSGRGMNS